MCKTPASRKRMVSLSHVAEVESKWEQSERWEERLEDVGQQVLRWWWGMVGGKVGGGNHLFFMPEQVIQGCSHAV